MQAFTPILAKEKLTVPAGDLAAGELRYRADVGGETARVVEQGPIRSAPSTPRATGAT
jgi:hypothetical protein